jgi:hypothetical protein
LQENNPLYRLLNHPREEAAVRDLRVGQVRYRLSGSDCEIALAHALGRALIELQQLEFTIASYLEVLASRTMNVNSSFDLFASKTFGNLVREMQKHELLTNLATNMRLTKERRDFFIHKFLFHRFGGELFTTEAEYELLTREAHDLGVLFAESRTQFDDLMLQKAPIVMFGGRIDPNTQEVIIVRSEFAKEHHDLDDSDGANNSGQQA